MITVTKSKLILFLIVAFLLGYLIRSVLVAIKEFKIKNIPESKNENNIFFDINEIKVGDVVGSMKVVKKEPYFERVKDTISLISNVKISFGGKIQITGNYFFDAPMGAVGSGGTVKSEDYNKVCMSDLAKESLAKIPRPVTKSNTTWFCFSNTSYAFDQFAPIGSKGKAVVVIDNYTINIYPSEVHDIAELLEVVKKND